MRFVEMDENDDDEAKTANWDKLKYIPCGANNFVVKVFCDVADCENGLLGKPPMWYKFGYNSFYRCHNDSADAVQLDQVVAYDVSSDVSMKIILIVTHLLFFY